MSPDRERRGRSKGNWRRLAVDFWTKPIAAEPLGLMRICAGVSIMISSLISIAPNLGLFWFPDGLIPLEVAADYVKQSDRFSLLMLTDSATAIVILFCLWMASLACVICGLFTRLSCVVAWCLTVSFNMRSLWVLNGGDDVAVALLFYLMIAPSGAALSLDARRRKTPLSAAAGQPRAAAFTMVKPWSIRLIQIQLVVIYLMNGVNKLNLDPSNDYLTGEAVYWVLNDITLTRWSYEMLPVPMIICRLLSWATLVFEIGFPFFILFRRIRPWLLLAGLCFHLGILLTMEINWFGQNTACYYPIMLSPAAATRVFRRRADR